MTTNDIYRGIHVMILKKMYLSATCPADSIETELAGRFCLFMCNGNIYEYVYGVDT